MRTANSIHQHDERLDDKHQLLSCAFASKDISYRENLAALYNVIQPVSHNHSWLCDYLLWRLYKRLFRRPKGTNYHDLKTRLVCNGSRPWPSAICLLPGMARTDPDGPCLSSLAIWFHFTTTTLGFTVRTHARCWTELPASTT